MAESKLREFSTDFAVKVIKLCETMKGHDSLVNQLERSATSIGANIREAKYAHSRPGFIAEMQNVTKSNTGLKLHKSGAYRLRYAPLFAIFCAQSATSAPYSTV